MHRLRRTTRAANRRKGKGQGRNTTTPNLKVDFMSAQTSQTVYPEVGDLVVASVTRVEDYGAYVKLDEFSGIEGLVHISEISTTWVRNIREHARQGQKLVLKVLRVNPQRNQI